MRTAVALERYGYTTEILPYPGTCGISFKQLAAKTGIGEIGDSFLFLHREWGPWTHLRIALTNAETPKARQRDFDAVCTHCGRCIDECPGRAIAQGRHDLDACASAQSVLSKQVSIPGA